tara:strand:+ start:176 stop:907 length:732 start_codon:yes stop_codon:yes gene_type:complete
MPKKPKDEEKLVIESLRVQGFKNLLYEPINNKPPDILVDDVIAVEVRRLNQNYLIDGKPTGLEQEYISTINTITKILSQDPEEHFGESFYYSIKIRRPVPSKRVVKRILKKIVKSLDYKTLCKFEISIKNSIKLEVHPVGKKLSSLFELLSTIDSDAGGWAITETVKNVKMIIDEKSEKIKDYKSMYDQWWLALVDTISYELTQSEIKEIESHLTTFGNFDKILIVNRLNKNHFNFIEKKKTL